MITRKGNDKFCLICAYFVGTGPPRKRGEINARCLASASDGVNFGACEIEFILCFIKLLHSEFCFPAFKVCHKCVVGRRRSVIDSVVVGNKLALSR